MRAVRTSLRHIVLAVVVLAVVAGGVESARATILTFNIKQTSNGLKVPDDSDLTSLYQDYGDNVSLLSTPAAAANTTFNYLQGNGFTPNVTTAYSASGGNGLKTWDQNGGVWNHAIYRGSITNDGSAFFSFTPASLYQVKLNSFDMQIYSGGSPSSSGIWQVHKDTTGGTVLASGTYSLVNSNLSLINFDTTAAGWYSGTLVLEITQTASSAGFAYGHAAFDNINFDQQLIPVPPVPEPATATLLCCGLLALRAVRRARQ